MHLVNALYQWLTGAFTNFMGFKSFGLCDRLDTMGANDLDAGPVAYEGGKRQVVIPAGDGYYIRFTQANITTSPQTPERSTMTLNATIVIFSQNQAQSAPALAHNFAIRLISYQQANRPSLPYIHSAVITSINMTTTTTDVYAAEYITTKQLSNTTNMAKLDVTIQLSLINHCLDLCLC